MFEEENKVYFSPLPFSHKIVYFEIKQNQNLFVKNVSFNNEHCDDSKSTFNKNNHYGKKKTTIKLSEKALNFQFSFYQIFTTRKRFPKKYVALIHNEICHNLNLRRINRDETRSIFLYFENFSKYAEKILIFIQNNKEEIIKKLPELKIILR